MKESLEGLVVATIYYLDKPAEVGYVDFFEHTLEPALIAAGASILAYFVTESSPNTFPALPVREGEHVFISFSGFQDQTEYEHHVAALKGSSQGRDEISKALTHRIKGGPEVLRLSPTTRSQLRGRV